MGPPSPKRPRQDEQTHGNFVDDDDADEMFEYALSQMDDVLREIDDKVSEHPTSSSRTLVREYGATEPLPTSRLDLSCLPRPPPDASAPVAAGEELVALRARAARQQRSLEERSRELRDRKGELELFRFRLSAAETDNMNVRRELLAERTAAAQALADARKATERELRKAQDQAKFLDQDRRRAIEDRSRLQRTLASQSATASQLDVTAESVSSRTPRSSNFPSRDSFFRPVHLSDSRLNATTDESVVVLEAEMTPAPEAAGRKDAEAQTSGVVASAVAPRPGSPDSDRVSIAHNAAAGDLLPILANRLRLALRGGQIPSGLLSSNFAAAAGETTLGKLKAKAAG